MDEWIGWMDGWTDTSTVKTNSGGGFPCCAMYCRFSCLGLLSAESVTLQLHNNENGFIGDKSNT